MYSHLFPPNYTNPKDSWSVNSNPPSSMMQFLSIVPKNHFYLSEILQLLYLSLALHIVIVIIYYVSAFFSHLALRLFECREPMY